MAIAAAIAVTAITAGVLPAGAAPQPVSTPVTGSMGTGAAPIPLTGTVFQGTFDPETGAFEGKFVFPGVDINVTAPVAATIGLQVQQPDPGTGTIDLITNEATYSADLVLALLTLDASGLGTWPLQRCNYLMHVDLIGTYDPDAGTVDLSDDAFSITAAPETNRCVWDALGSSLAGAIDPEVVGSDNSLATVMDLGVSSAAPPAPPAPPTPPAAPPAAAPTVAAPDFTG